MYANYQILFNLVFCFKIHCMDCFMQWHLQEIKRRFSCFELYIFVFLNHGFRNMSCGCYEVVYCTEKYMWSIICQLNEGVCATRQGICIKLCFQIAYCTF